MILKKYCTTAIRRLYRTTSMLPHFTTTQLYYTTTCIYNLLVLK